MSKGKVFQWSTLLLVVLNLAVISFFLTRGPKHANAHERHREGPQKIITEKLGFDDEQIAVYQELISDHREKVAEADMQITEAKSELYKLLQSPDAQKKDSLIQIINQHQLQVEEIHFNHFLEIKAICRGEQVDRFNNLSEELARLFAPQKPEKTHGPKRR